MKRAAFSILAALAALAFGTAVPAAAGPTLDRVASNKRLVVASNGNWPPQAFMNDKNELDGFDVDVAKEIAKRLGVAVSFVTPNWQVITAGKWNGRWDVSVGSMVPTKARAQVLSFPAVYYYTPASFVVHKDSKAQKVSDLDGKRVGAIESSTFETYLKRDLVIEAAGVPPFTFQVTPGAIVTMETSGPLMDDLRLGDGVRLHGVLDTLPVVSAAIANGYPFRVLGEPVFYEPLAIATDKGDPEFDARLAAIIEAMRADGTLSQLSMKWYKADYTKTAPAK